MKKAYLIADQFVGLLSSLGVNRLQRIAELNRSPDYAGCCASHDFCDANMAMLAAYCRVYGVHESDVDLDASAEEMNKAWDIAKRKIDSLYPAKAQA